MARTREEKPDSAPRLCKALTKAGKPCSATATPGGAYCPWHDASDQAAEQRRAWSASGGRARSNAARARRQIPDSLRDVEAALYRALTRLERGELEPTVANAMSAVARALAALQQPGDIEARLSELERQLDQRKAG